MPHPLLRRCCILGLALLLSACALPHRIPDDDAAPSPVSAPAPTSARAGVATTPAPQQPPAATSAPSSSSSATVSSATTPALQALISAPPQLPKLPLIPPAPSRQVAAAPPPRVDGLPLPVLPQLPSNPASVPSAADAPAQRARAALADLNDRANLSDAQVRRINAAQSALDAGNSTRAAQLAVKLDDEVRSARQHYTVAAGESLWQIAAKSSIYGNGYLWPLIWDANRARLPQPARLFKGLKLKIVAYPTLEQTSAALEYSHHHGLDGFPSPR